MTDLELDSLVRKAPGIENFEFDAWQLRAARAAADLSIQTLADRSGVSVSTIRRAEAQGAQPMTRVNRQALIAALSECGVAMSTGVSPATVTMTPQKTAEAAPPDKGQIRAPKPA